MNFEPVNNPIDLIFGLFHLLATGDTVHLKLWLQTMSLYGEYSVRNLSQFFLRILF